MKTRLSITLLLILLIGVPRLFSQDSDSKDWNKTVTNKQIGSISIGDSVDSAIRLLSEKYIIMYDSAEMCVGCFDEFDYYYRVSNNGNDTIFLIKPSSDKETVGLIYSMVLCDSTFVTDKGIKIGSTVKDLKESYKINSAYFTYEDGMFLFAEDWDGSFGIMFETRADYAGFNFEAPKPEDIPEHLKVFVIGIY